VASELIDEDASTWLRGPARESPSARAFVVRVEAGESEDAGRSLVLDARAQGRALVGTSPVCDLRLTDRQVSRRHLALEVAGEHLRVADLNSRNGTTVGALRVVEAVLEGGERVGIGATMLRIERRDAADVHAPALPPVLSFGTLVGASTEMRRLHPLCQRLARSDIPVLIEGETGTGKEALARALHDEGPRSKGPFVVFDCTAVPPALVESELFGHERGAFTGAVAARQGVFEEANGGTLLIDEIGDLDPVLQPKLLRAVERGEVRPVGGSRTIQVDLRVLAATRRDLDKEVEGGRFRDDLFHRLVVARVELPPLRKRVGDVRLLAAHFCTQLGGEAHALPESLLQAWESWSWPGNVRELRNAVARYLALGDLEQGWVPPSTRGTDAQADLIERVLARHLPLAEARQQVVEAFEQRYLERVLEEHGGNVTRAAEASGIARRHFHRLWTRSTK
jgi:transcriptional regulator with GAF, ATPase, and Fis domain